MDNPRRKAFIFIVYQNSEYLLAVSLQHLLQAWGYDVFHCRQSDRDGKAYRDELRENIRKADLVLLLLSREFRWSAYCQAEAGTTMALEKPYIPVLVPPAQPREVGDEIAPVLEGVQLLYGADPNFVPLLQAAVVRTLNRSKESLRNLISRLQELERVSVSTFAPTNVEDDDKKRADVLGAIKEIEDHYRLYQPKKSLMSLWPSLADESCKSSIVGNIINHFKLPCEETSLIFVGVSLKFSLHLIWDALERHAQEVGASKSSKTLCISLVYMDDQSHILHALKDSRDMDAIRLNFGQNWQGIKKKWQHFCGKAIELAEPALYRIDYIPPRVGILMETGSESTLYAGRCAFKQPHRRLPVFTLDVGENEYIFYKRGAEASLDDPNDKAIEQFKASFNAYKESHNNSGVTPIWDSDAWIERLRQYIDKFEGREEITFISGTATKFESLIIKAAKSGAKVKTYVRDSGSPPRRVRNLHDRLRKELGDATKMVQQHRYQHPATFRAVVMGNIAIGLQIYVNADDAVGAALRRKATNLESVKKLPLCLIITPCFEHFEGLKNSVLTFADGDPMADEVFSFP